jgi:hypothetical protein
MRIISPPVNPVSVLPLNGRTAVADPNKLPDLNGYRSMRKLTLAMAAIATIPCLVPSDRAEALPFNSLAGGLAAVDEVTCRPPPWYRGWATQAPFVCADFWWWPRYYYRGIGMHHRRHYRTH